MKFIGLDIGTTTIGSVVLDRESWTPIPMVEKNTAVLDSGHVWETVLRHGIAISKELA
jgi:Ethanolamine utilization protein EutJ (predicted chaperonin)